MSDHFVGRDAELDTLDELLTQARAGAPHVVLLVGEPGIGKTTLIDGFLRRHRDVTSLRAGGDDSEMLYSYGIVRQLAASAGPAGLELAGQLAQVAPVPDPIAIGSQLLALLGERQQAGPAVLVIDDIQWADDPSVKSITFGLRRLQADQLLVILAVREESIDELPDGLLRIVRGELATEIRLGGLAEHELAELAGKLGIGSFPARAARRLRSGTDGHPLFARELLREFPPESWGAQDVLPPPRSFRHLVRQRYRRCSTDGRRLVDAEAVIGLSAPLALTAQLADLPHALEAISDAERADLLQLVDASYPGSVRFPHPLVRSAVYSAIDPPRRSALHARAAQLLDDTRTVLQHRFAAARQPDEGLAADLSAFAATEIHNGEWVSAATHLVRSSRLSPQPADRQRRLLRAVNFLVIAGAASQAAHLAEEVASFPPGPLRDSTLGYLATATRGPAEAGRLLSSAWQQVDPAADRELAATIALQSAIHFHGRLDGPATATWSARAIELTESDDPMRFVAETHRAFGLGYSGRFGEALPVVEDVTGTIDGSPDARRVQHGAAHGWLRLINDDLVTARSMLHAVAVDAARLVTLNTAAFSYAHLARAEYLAGAWHEALVHIENAIALTTESESDYLRSLVFGMAVVIPAARGEWAAAHTYADLAAAEASSYERAVAAAALAGAQLAAARDEPERVLVLLDPIRAMHPRQGIDEPGIWPWPELYADALTALGRTAEADAFLIPHELLAHRRRRASAIARLARARGSLESRAGRDSVADQAFQLAAGQIQRLAMPYEQALIELAHGRHLVRTNRRKAAAKLLTAAGDRFTALGAAPFLAQTVAELRACGITVEGTTRQRLRIGLTSQELVVARLIADGKTNREAAADLVVSVKTIEYHLSNVYAKLGGITRRQLRSALADHDRQAPLQHRRTASS